METATVTDERRGPGRPRVKSVVERDESVYRQLTEKGSLQVRDIAEAVGVGRNATYLSLWRLRREGRVAYKRDGALRLWSAVTK